MPTNKKSKKKKTKEYVCFKILNEYELMVDGPSTSLIGIKDRWPRLKKKETFGEWKKRFFKRNVRLKVYKPCEPSDDELMSSLAEECGGQHLKKIFERYKKYKDRVQRKEVEKTEHRLSTFPKKTLASIVDEIGDQLQPEVKGFFENKIKGDPPKIIAFDEDIDAEDLLMDLIQRYNDVVRMYNEMKRSQNSS